MSGFTDVFGGSPVQPSNVAYNAVTIGANLTFQWPAFCTGTQEPLARITVVTPAAASLSITLPDVTVVGTGQDVLLINTGAYTFTVYNSVGSVITTVAPGQQKYLYVADNSSPAGAWGVTLFGVGTSALDAGQLSGYGVKAIGATLNQSSPTALLASNYTVLASDRAKVYVNSVGAITLTLPSTSTVSNDFFFEFRNQGTGTVTIAPVGGELIDGSGTVVLQVNESCAIHSGLGAWYTIGRGRNASFNFTQLLKTVTGGTTILSLTEASNVVQTYSGTAVSPNIIVLPSVVQVYYIRNNVLGGYTFTVKSPTTGATLDIPYSQSAVVFCDGVNVTNASTTITGISALLLSGGSASSPSLALAQVNNGLYAPTSTTIGVSANGTNVATFGANGLRTQIGFDLQESGAFTSLEATDGFKARLGTVLSASYADDFNFNSANNHGVGVNADGGGQVRMYNSSLYSGGMYAGAGGLSLKVGAASDTYTQWHDLASAYSGAVRTFVNSVEVARFTSTGLEQCAIGATTPSTGKFTVAETTGNFGVGITPTYRLHTSVTGANNEARFETVTSGSPILTLSANGAGSGSLTSDRATGSLLIGVNGGEVCRFTNTGSFYLGQTTSGYVNSYSMSISTGAEIINHASGSASGNAYLGFGYSGSSIGTIEQDGTVGVRITGVTGVKFLATQVPSADANTLDDYEEGTFTATLMGSVTNPTIPVTTTGYYTKIGRQVTVSIYFSGFTTTGASGNLMVSGLPFAAHSTAGASVGSAQMANNGTIAGLTTTTNSSTTLAIQDAFGVPIAISAGTSRTYIMSSTYNAA